MRNLATGVLLVVGTMSASLGQAPTDVVIQWLDESGSPACLQQEAGRTLHISAWLEGVTQTTVQAEELVVDSTGVSVWTNVERGVYTVEALPWSWTLVVEPTNGLESDTITLILPSRSFQRLRKNPARVTYSEGHPGALLDEAQTWFTAHLDSLDLDQLMATGAVGGARSRGAEATAALKQAHLAADSVVASFLQIPPHTLWGDLMESTVREWQWSLGVVADGNALSSWLSQGEDSRTWSEKLASPGWCSSWELTHDRWWERLETERKPWRSWVATGDIDSLANAMQWTLNEVHLAMWMGESMPWRRWAQSWWDMRWKDQCDVAEIRRLSEQTKAHVLTAQSWGDVMWMLPNSELAPAWASSDGWRVWLVTREGSAAGLREWSILRSWLANQAPKDVSLGVLSVDSNEEGWGQTLSQRENIREQLRWVGRDPSWWDRLDLTTVPQVIVVRPDGEIQTHHAALPSQGLFAELKRWRLMQR